MWADSTFEDLVQYNDGFRTELIGTPEQVAERIVAYKRIGVDLFLAAASCTTRRRSSTSASEVLPIVRELEVRDRARPCAVPPTVDCQQWPGVDA